MTHKHILILNWRCPKNPLAGGAEMITLEHARAWVKSGYDVTWFAEKYVGADSNETIDGIRIERYGVGNKMHSVRAPFVYLWQLFLTIYRYWFVHKGSFDLIIDEVHGPIMWVSLWAWKSKKLIYVHEVAQDIWDKMLPWPLSSIGKMVEKFMYLVYRNLPFLTASESTKADLVKLGIQKKNITLIPHGLFIQPVSRLSKKSKNLKIVFIARLVKMKGIEETLQIFREILDTLPDAHLDVVGKGPDTYVQYLKKYVSSEGMSKNVSFHGFVSEKEKISLLQMSHFLIHTSVREGFGLVVIEANSQGTPAIVYDSPGLRDIVEESVNGHIVSYGHTNLAARRIISLYRDTKKYKKLAHSSIEFSHRYSWSEITNQSLKYLNDMNL